MADEALLMVNTGAYAYITDQAGLEYVAAVYCEKYLMPDIIFNSMGLAFAISKNNPYLEPMNQM